MQDKPGRPGADDSNQPDQPAAGSRNGEPVDPDIVDRRSEIQHARYGSCAFPPYRFVPGRNPHPTAHPDGHSYHPPGSPAPEVTFVDAANWRNSDDYLYGCDLYNHAYWWEAHEAWEGLWQLTDKKSVQGRFLQGLIQVSACHLKRYVAHGRGVERLLGSSVGYLKGVDREIGGAEFMGLALAGFLESLQAYYATFNPGRTVPAHDPAHYPYAILQVDQTTRENM